MDANLQVLHAFAEHGYRGRIAVSADTEAHEEQLRRAGADLTIRPLHVAAGPLLDRLHKRTA